MCIRDRYASSASEMVAEILQYFTEGIRIRNVEADSIYAGIMIEMCIRDRKRI